MGVFSRGEWWTEGHGDFQEAIRALYALQLQQLCAELRKSKAVFTPHLPGRFVCVDNRNANHVGREFDIDLATFCPLMNEVSCMNALGDRLVKGAMAKAVGVLQAHMDGDFETRLKGTRCRSAGWVVIDDVISAWRLEFLLSLSNLTFLLPSPIAASWTLQDDSPEAKGWLSEQGVEDAVYTVLNPIVATAAVIYPAIPAVKKAHKKAFAKYIKLYLRDQADVPTKIRCTFHWTDPPLESLPTQPPPVPVPKVIDLPGYLATQKENFPDLHLVGAGSMALYRRVREAHYLQKKEDRTTFRTGLIYLVFLGVADAIVSGL